MKKVKILRVLIFTLFLTNCASLSFEANPPFVITKVTYQNWKNHLKSISGTDINISYTSRKKVAFKELFYNEKQEEVSFKKDKNGTKFLLVQFKNKTTNNNFDIQLHGNSKKEFGNKPPQKQANFPFELKDTEAVLSYKEANTIKYVKIKNITKQQESILNN